MKALVLEAGFTGFRAELLRMEVAIPDLPLFATGLVFGNPSAQLLRARGVAPEQVVEAIATRLAAECGNPPRTRLQALLFEAVKD